MHRFRGISAEQLKGPFRVKKNWIENVNCIWKSLWKPWLKTCSSKAEIENTWWGQAAWVKKTIWEQHSPLHPLMHAESEAGASFIKSHRMNPQIKGHVGAVNYKCMEKMQRFCSRNGINTGTYIIAQTLEYLSKNWGLGILVIQF